MLWLDQMQRGLSGVSSCALWNGHMTADGFLISIRQIRVIFSQLQTGLRMIKPFGRGFVTESVTYKHICGAVAHPPQIGGLY